MGLKTLVPLLHGNSVFLLTKSLRGGELRVANLISHYPFRMLYWQLHSNLSGSLIRRHNEIAAYLIYQVIFSCHLLVSKNKPSCLGLGQPAEADGHIPRPSSLTPRPSGTRTCSSAHSPPIPQPHEGMATKTSCPEASPRLPPVPPGTFRWQCSTALRGLLGPGDA